MTDYQPRTPERLIEILKAQDENPRSWQQEAALTIARLQAEVIHLRSQPRVLNSNPMSFM
jgi:hypothetical protein